MKRKRWTPQEETDSVLKTREKRKWQIALRRYVLLENRSSYYAPYFGLDMNSFRKWIAVQFDEDMNWDNFSQAWQFDHIVPVTYFDFEQESDLRLCWNFTNIRAEKLDVNKNRGNRVDVLAAKAYFAALYQRTQYSLCLDMVKKIESIEVSEIESTHNLEIFILNNREYIDTIASFSPHEYNNLNEGISVKQILAEREFLKNLGS